MYEIALHGCDYSTLAGYLKALGVFKVVSEQLDAEARIYWKGSTPYLVFKEARNKDELVSFFLNEYKPLPVVIPWSGSNFFSVGSRNGDSGPFKEPPTKGKIIEAFLASKSQRLSEYRKNIEICLEIIDKLNLSKKDVKGERKAYFVGLLRSWLSEQMVDFIDVASVVEEDKLFTNTILGSGGGNDGNLHFGSNYMQCLWLCLPDFKQQRTLSKKYKQFNSEAACRESLYAEFTEEKTSVLGASMGLFSSGHVGGPNAFEGFEAEALRNPWDLIFLIEGLTMFKGALSSRSGSMPGRRGAAFPFTTKVSFDNRSTIVVRETGQNREVWLPVWHSPATLKSLQVIFSEGRAEVSGRQAQDSIDFFRAVASLGVDRGIDGFQRYGIVKGRVGGENYHTAIDLGFVNTYDKPVENVDLFTDIDGWIRDLRNASQKKGSVYGALLRRIESSIVAYCRRGEVKHIQNVLIALGKAEKSIARSGGERFVNPLSLSPRWVRACDDGSTEYRIACALSSICDNVIGPIRLQLEPVEWNPHNNRVSWGSGSRSTFWGYGSLCDNMIEVLQRRLLVGSRSNMEFLPIQGAVKVGMAEVYQFLMGNVNEKKMNDLIWALSTVRWDFYVHEQHSPQWKWEQTPEIPRQYSLIKLLYLPTAIKYDYTSSRWCYTTDPSGIRIPYMPEILYLLKAGRAQEAYKRAFRRLKSSGLKAIGGDGGVLFPEGALDPKRLAASMLIPVWEIDTLAGNILAPPKH